VDAVFCLQSALPFPSKGAIGDKQTSLIFDLELQIRQIVAIYIACRAGKRKIRSHPPPLVHDIARRVPRTSVELTSLSRDQVGRR
jgi:hypothetical protein